MKITLLRLFLCITIGLPCLSFADPLAYEIVKDTMSLPLLSPAVAQRRILKLRLSNGLEAYIISDPSAQQSAAALSVDAGSWQDPPDYPGTAHFLEHMLFLGTVKYPQESSFDSFVGDHEGMTNAYTQATKTNFLFSINNAAFDEALDRFSDFFKEPLFNPSGVGREMQAVDQEYAKDLNSDDWRREFVHKAVANPKHPESAFNIGNRETLSHISQNVLKAWYKEHYSANLMHLVVFSPLPLEQLKELVIRDFSQIPNKGQKPYANGLSMRSPEVLGQVIYAEPLQEIFTLSLRWEIPPSIAEEKQSNPAALIGYVLGNEAKGGLVAQLREEKLAENLSVDQDVMGTKIAEFALDFELTPKGLKEIDTVIERCFQAIANLKKHGVPRYLFDEIVQMQKINYQYPPAQKAYESVEDYIKIINYEPLETFPLVTNIVQQYNPTAIQQFLDILKPQNTEIILMAPKQLTGIQYDREAKWFKVPYTIQKPSADVLKVWETAKENPAIFLPEPNPFIPQNLTLLNKGSIDSSSEASLSLPQPKAIVNLPEATIYFAPDAIYHSPEISWNIEIKTPSIDAGNAQSVVLGDLYIKHLTENLNQVVYLASLGGIKCHLNTTEEGFGITIEGYNDKASILLQAVLKQLKNFDLSAELLEYYKESLRREYQNFSKEDPLKKAQETLKSILYRKFATHYQEAHALKNINLATWNDFTAQLFDKTFTQGLLYGNLTEGQTLELWKQIKSALSSRKPYLKANQPKKSRACLPSAQGPFYIEQKAQAAGNAVELAIQYASFSFKARAALHIISKSIGVPFFNSLRTKQQTGYIVDNNIEESERHMFALFAVQSDSHDGRDLLARFELVIDTYLQGLETEGLPEKQFDEIKNSMLISLQKMPSSLSEMGLLLKTLAFDYDGDFNWRAKRIEGAKELSYDECLAIARQLLGHENKRRLAVIIKGSKPSNRILSYIKAKSLKTIRNASTYTTREKPDCPLLKPVR